MEVGNESINKALRRFARNPREDIAETDCYVSLLASATKRDADSRKCRPRKRLNVRR